MVHLLHYAVIYATSPLTNSLIQIIVVETQDCQVGYKGNQVCLPRLDMIEQTAKMPAARSGALKTTTALTPVAKSAKKLHSSTGSRQPSYALVQSFQPGIGALKATYLQRSPMTHKTI